jgi:hypothetical protein
LPAVHMQSYNQSGGWRAAPYLTYPEAIRKLQAGEISFCTPLIGTCMPPDRRLWLPTSILFPLGALAHIAATSGSRSVKVKLTFLCPYRSAPIGFRIRMFNDPLNKKSLGGVRQSLSVVEEQTVSTPLKNSISLFVRSNLSSVHAAQKMLRGSCCLLYFSQGSVSSVCRSAKPK